MVIFHFVRGAISEWRSSADALSDVVRQSALSAFALPEHPLAFVRLSAPQSAQPEIG